MSPGGGTEGALPPPLPHWTGSSPGGRSSACCRSVHLAIFAAMPLARPQHLARAGQDGLPGQQIRPRHKAHHQARVIDDRDCACAGRVHPGDDHLESRVLADVITGVVMKSPAALVIPVAPAPSASIPYGTRPTGQGLTSWTRPHAGQNRGTDVTWVIRSWIATPTGWALHQAALGSPTPRTWSTGVRPCGGLIVPAAAAQPGQRSSSSCRLLPGRLPVDLLLCRTTTGCMGRH